MGIKKYLRVNSLYLLVLNDNDIYLAYETFKIIYKWF